MSWNCHTFDDCLGLCYNFEHKLLLWDRRVSFSLSQFVSPDAFIPPVTWCPLLKTITSLHWIATKVDSSAYHNTQQVIQFVDEWKTRSKVRILPSTEVKRNIVTRTTNTFNGWGQNVCKTWVWKKKRERITETNKVYEAEKSQWILTLLNKFLLTRP